MPSDSMVPILESKKGALTVMTRAAHDAMSISVNWCRLWVALSELMRKISKVVNTPIVVNTDSGSVPLVVNADSGEHP